MACDRLAPRGLSRTNLAGAPAAALWAGGVWSALLSLSDKVDLLVNWATLAILLLSSLVVVALFVFRRRGGEPPAYRCTGYPVTPVIYLGVCLAVAWASVVHSPWRSLLGLLVVAAGFPVYSLLARRGRTSE
jgi:APA family basic amino acid/polyamine antiporter